MKAMLGLALAVLVSCNGPAPPERDADPTTTGAATPRPSASVEVLPFVGEGTPLEPGRYRFDAFEPSLTFEVGSGWEGGHTHVEFFDVWSGDDLAVAFARPSFVRGDEGRLEIDAMSPRDALGAIASGDVEAGPIEPTRLDGRPAVEMHYTVPRPTVVFGGPTGELTIEPGWNQRAIALEVDGALVLVIVMARGDAPASDAEPVLSSIRFD